MSKGWIGVDLDGTLARYDTWRGPAHIGEPIAPMVERVKRWLQEGRDVRIFTARVTHDGTDQREMEAAQAIHAIKLWCHAHLGAEMTVTNVKDYGMIELWDDRAVQVIANTGEPVGKSTRGLS